MRLRSDLWVAAYLRRCNVEGASAYLRRRGAAEAGAIFGPAPQSLLGEGERLFVQAHKEDWLAPASIEARLRRELEFDTDLWIVEVEDRQGRNFLDLAAS